MKKLELNNGRLFLTQLYEQFSSSSLLDNVYKVCVCQYEDGTTYFILICNQKKDNQYIFKKNNLHNFVGDDGISLGSLSQFFGFDHVILEKTLHWTLRKKGCNNWRCIKHKKL